MLEKSRKHKQQQPNPQESTEQDSGMVDADGARLSCLGSGVVVRKLPHGAHPGVVERESLGG